MKEYIFDGDTAMKEVGAGLDYFISCDCDKNWVSNVKDVVKN